VEVGSVKSVAHVPCVHQNQDKVLDIEMCVILFFTVPLSNMKTKFLTLDHWLVALHTHNFVMSAYELLKSVIS
jgi:hypothetical protein